MQIIWYHLLIGAFYPLANSVCKLTYTFSYWLPSHANDMEHSPYWLSQYVNYLVLFLLLITLCKLLFVFYANEWLGFPKL